MQHDRIWERYIDFIKDVGVIESAVCVFRRYLMLEPDHIETYIAYLISVGHFDEAARLLAKVVNDEGFTSMEGKTNHQLWCAHKCGHIQLHLLVCCVVLCCGCVGWTCVT